MEFLIKHIACDVVKADGDDPRTIRGLASTFEEPSNHDSHGDIINPRAFDEAIAEAVAGTRKIKMLNGHGAAIGLWKEFEITPRGLRVTGRISDVAEGNDVLTLVNDGVVDGLSIGFPFLGSEYRDLEHMTPWGAPVREWTKVNLREVSPTPFPSNQNALMELRSARRDEYQRRVAAEQSNSGLEEIGLLIMKASLELYNNNTVRRLERLNTILRSA